MYIVRYMIVSMPTFDSTTMDSVWIPYGSPMDPLWIHYGFTIDNSCMIPRHLRLEGDQYSFVHLSNYGLGTYYGSIWYVKVRSN